MWNQARALIKETTSYLDSIQDKNSNELDHHEQWWLSTEVDSLEQSQARLTSLFDQESAINLSLSLTQRAENLISKHNNAQVLILCDRAQEILSYIKVDPPGFSYQQSKKFINMAKTKGECQSKLQNLQQIASELLREEQELNQRNKNPYQNNSSRNTPVTITSMTNTSASPAPISSDNNLQTIREKRKKPTLATQKKSTGTLGHIARFFRQANCTSGKTSRVIAHK